MRSAVAEAPIAEQEHPAAQLHLPSTLTNASPAGAEIECVSENLLDTPIVVYAGGLGRFEGHVVWHHGGKYGVKFNNSGRKQAQLAEELDTRDGATRRHERTRANRLAQFTREDGTIVQCTVIDFSTSGVLVEARVRRKSLSSS